MNTKHFTSPLKEELDRFLEYKRAAGCRYQAEEFILRCLDRFLAGYLVAKDPVITFDLVRAFVRQSRFTLAFERHANRQKLRLPKIGHNLRHH